MKLLAITADKRDATVPNVPTMGEAGVAGLEVFSWQAFTAPKGLPADVKAKLEPALIAAIRHPDVVKRFTEMGFETVGGTPAEFARFLDAELARWKGVIEAGGIKQTD